jgi:hypothetical protein
VKLTLVAGMVGGGGLGLGCSGFGRHLEELIECICDNTDDKSKLVFGFEKSKSRLNGRGCRKYLLCWKGRRRESIARVLRGCCSYMRQQQSATSAITEVD